MGNFDTISDLKDFPAPKGNTGIWPWLEPEVPSLQDPASFPSISVITPNLNGSIYLEETIRSVLLQAYPRLEYIIMDGESSDGSVDIIKKYEPWLTYWESKKDSGQPNAINKGIQKATGDWIAYLNSDDLYLPFALFDIGRAINRYPSAEWIAANTRVTDTDGNLFNTKKPDVKDLDRPEKWLTYELQVPQHSTFIHKSIPDLYSDFDEKFQYVFDLEYYMRLGCANLSPIHVDVDTAAFRIHDKSKSKMSRLPFLHEQERLIDNYAPLMSEEVIESTRYTLNRMIAENLIYEAPNLLQKRNGYHIAFQYISRALARDRSVIKTRPFWGALKKIMF